MESQLKEHYLQDMLKVTLNPLIYNLVFKTNVKKNDLTASKIKTENWVD